MNGPSLRIYTRTSVPATHVAQRQRGLNISVDAKSDFPWSAPQGAPAIFEGGAYGIILLQV